MTAATSPTGHSRFGFSSFARRIACPASATREDGIADTTSAAAALGTLLHDLSARVLLGEIDLDAVRAQVDKQSAQQVEIYTDYVRHRTREMNAVLLVEQRFHIPLHEELWGTSDAVIIGSDEIEVVDLKTGGGYEVHAREEDGGVNIQAAGYLLGALHEVSGEFSRLSVTIVQPRRGGIKTTSVSWDELFAVSELLTHTIDLALSSQPIASTGSHCTFCRAKSTCDEFKNRRFDAARKAFSTLEPGA